MLELQSVGLSPLAPFVATINEDVLGRAIAIAISMTVSASNLHLQLEEVLLATVTRLKTQIPIPPQPQPKAVIPTPLLRQLKLNPVLNTATLRPFLNTPRLNLPLLSLILGMVSSSHRLKLMFQPRKLCTVTRPYFLWPTISRQPPGQ